MVSSTLKLMLQWIQFYEYPWNGTIDQDLEVRTLTPLLVWIIWEAIRYDIFLHHVLKTWLNVESALRYIMIRPFMMY